MTDERDEAAPPQMPQTPLTPEALHGMPDDGAAPTGGPEYLAVPRETAEEDAPAPEVQPPVTIAQILADWRRQIDTAEYMQRESAYPDLWTKLQVPIDEITQVADAVPAVVLPPVDAADPAALYASLQAWTQAINTADATREIGEQPILGVSLEALEAVVLSLGTRLRDEQRARARKQADQVRVTRLITYTGPREDVEEAVRRSLHGSRPLNTDGGWITAVTVDEVPERVLAQPMAAPAPRDLALVGDQTPPAETPLDRQNG